MRRGTLLAVAFVLTRVLMAQVSVHPELYPDGSADSTLETEIYEHKAEKISERDLGAYKEVPLEYPPGSLALMLVPETVAPDNYLGAFVLQSIVFDALGFAATLCLARRRATWWAPTLWLVLLPAVGPVAYTRLDLGVAAALAWAVERLERGRWGTAAFLLGIGAGVKVTPVLLVPLLVAAGGSRWRTAGAAVLGCLLVFIPFLDRLPDVYDEVLVRNVYRGVHAESLWGSLALLGTVLFGFAGEVVPAFGASDLSAPYDGFLGLAANGAALAVLVGAVVFTARRVRRGDAEHTILVCSATFILLTAVGRVFSPQYLVWLVPLVAASASLVPRRIAPVAASLAGALVLAHVVYPVLFLDYLAVETGAIVLGALRHVFLLSAGVLGARVAWRHRPHQDGPGQRAGPKPVWQATPP